MLLKSFILEFVRRKEWAVGGYALVAANVASEVEGRCNVNRCHLWVMTVIVNRTMRH
jgi:hypothetical protein